MKMRATLTVAALPVLFIALAATTPARLRAVDDAAWRSPASQTGTRTAESFRTFEMRAVSSDPKADGETDFKGETAILSTEERVAFLKAYADVAAKWFGDPDLKQRAVGPGEAESRLAQIKPQPLTAVRKTIRLNDGWKQAGVAAGATAGPGQPWRTRRGVQVKNGELLLPAGGMEILDLAASSGWRFELRWDARLTGPGNPAHWRFGEVRAPESASLKVQGWHAFRLQADLAERRGYVSMDGSRVADFAMEPPAGRPTRFSIASDAPVAIRNLAFIDYRRTNDVRRPFEPVVLAHDTFTPAPEMKGWTQSSYDDGAWPAATLPCARGGFLQTGEDLYLRRSVDLPAARRVLLEVEALDPSGEIYVNGSLAATIPSRLPVMLDITKWATAGVNVLAFKVNHNWIEDPVFHATIDPATGWFAGRATLHLIGGDTTIRDLLVNTASLDPRGRARQAHRLSIEHAGSQPFEGTLDVTYRPWYPNDGPQAATRSIAVRVQPGAAEPVSVDVDLPAATLWTPATPRLYAVTATLRDKSGRAVDDAVTTTGVRTLAQSNGQFLLNGAPALLIGGQNMGFRPYPDFEDAARFNRSAQAVSLMTEMLAIKNMGGNLLRIHVHSANNSTGSINDPRIAELADQLGLALFWSGPSWVRQGDERSIDTAHEAEYIRQVYNHPSIVHWELSNHPNSFKQDDSPQRTHDFVRKTVQAVLAVDTSRLITPTTFWEQAHYGNDLGTVDYKQRPITPVAEYTHPLVTRGSQDSITGYGKEWSVLRKWPTGLAADTLRNGIRAWFNFEHEESGGQANWALSTGWPWHRLRSYEAPYEEGSIGRVLAFDEWRASQAWQAFSAYESMRKQIQRGVAGFSWCTIEGGANSGTYEKPLIDPLGHAKLAWHIHKLLAQPVLAGSDNVDTVYGPADTVTPVIVNLGPARTVDLTVTVRASDGSVVDTRAFPGVRLEAGRSVQKLAAFRPKLPASGFVVIEYAVEAREGRR